MAAQCVTKVELTVSCDNLMDKDIGSKSDPLCVLLMSSSDSKWYEVSSLWRVVITLWKFSGIWIWNTFPSLDKEVTQVGSLHLFEKVLCQPWTSCCIKRLQHCEIFLFFHFWLLVTGVSLHYIVPATKPAAISCFSTDWTNREDPELPQPQVCKEVSHRLLLWNGAKVKIWNLRHWQ